MRIATDLAAHLPSKWRLADTDDLAAWMERHPCPKCQAAVAFELRVRDRHVQRALRAKSTPTTEATR